MTHTSIFSTMGTKMVNIFRKWSTEISSAILHISALVNTRHVCNERTNYYGTPLRQVAIERYKMHRGAGADFHYDNEEELERRNERVKNYVTIEFVAIPPDFDILNYLSLREQAGVFKHKNVNKQHLEVIAEGVKASPVFAMLNNIRIDPATCLYFLKVIHELDLVLKSLYNPMRDHIDNFLEQMDDREGGVYIRGQMAETVNFVIINIFPMMNDSVINESMNIAQQLQQYQNEVDEKIAAMDNI